jgi:guanylate kinase
MTGKLIVISGFSGSGKDTLMNMLLKARPDFRRIVTHTSRPIRPGEKHGKDYYFVSHQEFETMIQEKKFIEHVLYGTHYKGTSKDEFQKVLSGQNIIWRIDLSRAVILEETFKEKFDSNTSTTLISSMTKIAITVSPNEALKRYKTREGKNTDLQEFRKRLKADLDVWNKYKNNFPHIVENATGKAENTLKKIIEIIENGV